MWYNALAFSVAHFLLIQLNEFEFICPHDSQKKENNNNSVKYIYYIHRCKFYLKLWRLVFTNVWTNFPVQSIL